ncbi:polysaccharide deacetylase family protein [Sphingomonas sanguinis]|uniref:Polysaccharide deacetylase family protein n=1 Tax=Sphingomonas sanguinis TaxID=33051 RepID=A0ABU5LR91_9SPHN|nr:polysaccharide deacetylase family protein [Sphingomonas sanguinis]MDZ7282236.1 polysaccharide deacetylase family protein [Sphingomonas sanguinis]QXT36044.1 polysaccharide deacetylase family protein [Sphingomonas sanguinis]
MPEAARPRRHEAASAAERIHWPDDFGRRFLVTVDVEEEFDWSAPLDRRHHATKAMRAFGAAHRRFAEAGVGLACMVDYPVAVDPAAIAILSECLGDGRSEIGAQLHSWVTPPYQEVVDPFTSHAGNLPIALETAKLDTLTDAITASFGSRPRIFRSGRYGLGASSLSLLASRGYRIDSSMRALHDYGATGGMDFSDIDAHGFRRDGMVELPLTSVYTGLLRQGGSELYRRAGRWPHGRGMLARAGLLNRIPLTPEGVGIGDALAGIDRAVADGVRLLTFSFHSPTLEPGHTPYVRDARDRALFDRWWDAVFDRLARHGVTAATIDEILAVTD